MASSPSGPWWPRLVAPVAGLPFHGPRFRRPVDVEPQVPVQLGMSRVVLLVTKLRPSPLLFLFSFWHPYDMILYMMSQRSLKISSFFQIFFLVAVKIECFLLPFF